jgi:D-glycero-alpha-D-manno-heptose-7-phosphate kinase
MNPSIEPVPVPRAAERPLSRVVASAPMRVSFAGGGSDLPPFVPGIGGRVVGTAVDLRVRALVEPFDPGWVRLELSAGGRVFTRRSSEPPRREIAFRLVEQALSQVQVNDGVRVRVETDVVPGAGLGGSAAAAVALLHALRTSVRAPADLRDLASQAVRMERDGLHLVCGSQDQVFAAVGGVLDLRFGEGGAPSVRALDADPAFVAEFGAGLLLIDTRVRRVSSDVLSRAANGRSIALTAELVAAAGDVARGIEACSLPRVLAGMRRSAAAKVRHDPFGSAAATALARGLAGLGVEVIRICGAGGGGHVLVWAPPRFHAAITRAVGGPSLVRKPRVNAPGVRLES